MPVDALHRLQQACWLGLHLTVRREHPLVHRSGAAVAVDRGDKTIYGGILRTTLKYLPVETTTIACNSSNKSLGGSMTKYATWFRGYRDDAGSLRKTLMALSLLLAGCTTAKETGVTMERTVPGTYAEVAKCVHRTMWKVPNKVYEPKIIDLEDENAAEVWATMTTTFITSAVTTHLQQRFEQQGDQVKMIHYIPALHSERERRQVTEFWDACTGNSG